MLTINVSENVAKTFERVNLKQSPHQLSSNRNYRGNQSIMFDETNDEHFLRIDAFSESVIVSKWGKFWTLKHCEIVNGSRKTRVYVHDEEGWNLVSVDVVKENMELPTF